MSRSEVQQKITFSGALVAAILVGFLLGNSAPRWYSLKPGHQDPYAMKNEKTAMMASPAPHGMDHPTVSVPDGKLVPEVKLSVEKDPKAGWNVHVETKNFKFAPEKASAEHVFGEGHAHIYVDDMKIARLYGNWFHIAEMKPGKHVVKVTLNANDHSEYVVGERHIEASQEVVAE